MMFLSFHFLGTLDAGQLAGQLEQEKNDKIWARHRAANSGEGGF